MTNAERITQLEREAAVLRTQVSILMDGCKRALAGFGRPSTRSGLSDFIERIREAVQDAIQSASCEVADEESTNLWISVDEKLPQEGVEVDVWLSRGERITDCSRRGSRWYFPVGFSERIPVNDNEHGITFWRYPPDPPIED